MERFPEFVIEETFVEHDELWTADDRECELRMQQRGRRALDRLFGENGAKEQCESLFVSSRFLLSQLPSAIRRPRFSYPKSGLVSRY